MSVIGTILDIAMGVALVVAWLGIAVVILGICVSHDLSNNKNPWDVKLK